MKRGKVYAKELIRDHCIDVHHAAYEDNCDNFDDNGAKLTSLLLALFCPALPL